MATTIRLKRGGRTHKPYYRMVVIDSRSRARGPELDSLGTYQPVGRPQPTAEINAHKALDWLRKGAQMSDTARNILRDCGILKHFAEGTAPEEAMVLKTDGKVVNKGYNAPPKPKEKPVRKVEEAVEEAAPAEAEAEA